MKHITEGYEGWASRNGLLQHAKRLEKLGLLEQSSEAVTGDRIFRLSEAGRRHALGGRDPQTQWSRAWDGNWRMIVFDVPVRRNSDRERIRRHLRAQHFGCLQRSVWITPDPLTDEQKILDGGAVNVESLLLLEARPTAGESDQDIATGAWDFKRINRQYEHHQKILGSFPDSPLTDETRLRKLRRWARDEHAAWIAAISDDPLLPERLLPAHYLGKRAWATRNRVLEKAGQRVRNP
jgi:phenylacetic acid degradation operon negative regulatory protein